MKFIDATTTAAPFGGRKGRGQNELAFLPAALEVVETPASPLAAVLEGSIISLFCIALVWAALSHIDIVASATGKIVPSGRTKIIQPFETGVVRAIRVHDGQRVKTGEVLIELDPTMSGADEGHIQSDLMAARLEAARLRAALAGNDDPESNFRPPADASAELIGMQRQFLARQVAEERAKIEEINRQEAQKEAERATIDAMITKIKETIPLLEERVKVRKSLYDKALESKLVYLTDLQDLVGQQQDLHVQESRYKEADAAVAALTQTRLKIDAEYQRALLDDLAKAEQKAAGLAQDLLKATQRTQYQILTAPVDGTVQQLAVHTIGGVVTPAQPLMVVVPADSHLEIEAMVSNRDIGFVHEGQEAEIKIDTFDFTRYGLIHGQVLSLSQDSITHDKPENSPTELRPGTATTTSEPRGQELVYAAHVSLDRTQMQVEENVVNLSPGMAATVEIKTGSRTILDYLLSPLIKYKQASMRER
jgi:hemolysin D